MNHFYYILLLATGLALSCISLPSCSHDNEVDSFFSTLGTIEMTGDCLSLESDTYGKLVPDNPGQIIAADADSTGQRVLVAMDFLSSQSEKQGETAVHIREVYKILTKKADDLRQTATDDTLGNAPIQIDATSISSKHLNVQFRFMGNNPNIAHRVSLVMTKNSALDNEGLLPVELRHDSGGDLSVTPFWGIASYTLESIPGYDDPRFKGFRIVYNSGADNQAQWVARKGANLPQTQYPSNRLSRQSCF